MRWPRYSLQDGRGGHSRSYHQRNDRDRDGRFRGKSGFRSDRPRFLRDNKRIYRPSRGLSRGGRGKKAKVEPHKLEGVFISRGKQELLTLNLYPGFKVYNEKRVIVDEGTSKIEYRTWNPFRSTLAAAIMGGIGEIHIKRGSRVLYLGAASGTTVSHVSDIVGADGMVYAVEISVRSGRDLVYIAQKKMNIAPIIADARHLNRYGMLIGAVDVIFSDLAQPDQARILALNAGHYLKPQGHFIISIKSSCIDSTASAEAVVATEVEKLRKAALKPIEFITLEPYQSDTTVIVGVYQPAPQAEKLKE